MSWASGGPAGCGCGRLACSVDEGELWALHCLNCLGPWNDGQLWAALPVVLLPVALRGRASDIQASRPELRGLAERMGDHSSPCPLCGLGQGGVEHLWTWCPAVALAWGCWAGGGAAPLPGTLRGDWRRGTGGARVVEFLH